MLQCSVVLQGGGTGHPVQVRKDTGSFAFVSPGREEVSLDGRNELHTLQGIVVDDGFYHTGIRLLRIKIKVP